MKNITLVEISRFFSNAAPFQPQNSSLIIEGVKRIALLNFTRLDIKFSLLRGKAHNITGHWRGDEVTGFLLQ